MFCVEILFFCPFCPFLNAEFHQFRLRCVKEGVIGNRRNYSGLDCIEHFSRLIERFVNDAARAVRMDA